MAKKKVKKKKPAEKPKKAMNEDSKIFAFLATFLSIVGFVIALLVKKDDQYVMHYAKQSLMVFIVFVIGWAIRIVPLLGEVLGPIIYFIGLILWIVSWIYALSGELKIVPIIGKYAKKISL